MPPDLDLLSRIPLSAHTVLAADCGDGALMAAYRRMNPRARLLGITADPDAALLAASHLDQVSIAGLEADPLPFELPDGLDCIIYDDPPWQLDTAWALFRRHAELLSPDGMMLIRVPNPDYWRMIARRLRGEPDNAVSGWGGHRPDPAGFSDHMAQAGLTMRDVVAQEPDDDADDARAFLAALAPALANLDADPEDFARRALPSHFIFRASKEAVPRMILSGNMLAPIGGVSDVRVLHPLRAVGSDPAVITTVTDRLSQTMPAPQEPRVFVLHRPSLMGEAGHDTLRKLTDAGYLIVTEFDDHPDHFDMMRRGGDLSFSGAHAVQTSTIAMANALRRYNPEVAVFPNAIATLPEVQNFSDPRRITLFFGALNRERDWQKLMPAINAVAGTAGERLRFQVIHDRLFFDALQTPHKTFTPTCDYETYRQILGSCEISFMPLGDTPFNRAKSDLKFIEAGACRVAALASSVVYGDSIEDGRTGLLFRDAAEFHARLLRLIAMPDLALALADAARRYVSDQRMLAYQVAPRIAWYRSLWLRRQGLETARQDRLRRRAAADRLQAEAEAVAAD